jgi:hypothetical protein
LDILPLILPDRKTQEQENRLLNSTDSQNLLWGLLVTISDHKFGEHREVIFASVIYPTKPSETNALLLADSIRTFAGSLSEATILYFTPACRSQLSTATKEKLNSLNVAAAAVA